MSARLGLILACLALGACAQLGDEAPPRQKAASPRQTAPSPEQREREERYIWFSELAALQSEKGSEQFS